MKNKRSKSSIFYDSTKNKSRKQEQNRNLEGFYQKKFTGSEKITNFLHENQDSTQTSNKSSYRLHSSIAPFLMNEKETSFRPNYNYKKEEKQQYLYSFTNSKFIYFLGTLDPKSYLIFVTLIGLLIIEDLNQTETKIVFAFISNIADTMQTLVEQEVILESYKTAVEARELGNALNQDLETIYTELDKIKQKLST